MCSSFVKIFCSLLILHTSAASEGDNIIELPTGKIRGHVLETPSGVPFQAFQGVPYAQPPINELRFKPPQPTEKWDGILDTVSDTRCCIQLYGTPANQSEDCLYLNVFVPQNTNETDMAVMMWIHGGGFRAGAADSAGTGPDYLIEEGVIVVSITYRLTIFGFLATEDMVSPGNNGIRDCIMALKWVHENIHLFGGDPNRITIFGQSAGGSAVSYLVLNEKHKGLIRGAIHESGTTLNMFNFQKNPKQIAYEVAAVIDENFTTSNTTQELFDLIRSSTTEVLVSATQKITSKYPDNTFKNIKYGHLFSGAIEPEHEDAVISDHLYEIFESQKESNITQMFGINSEESVGNAGNLDEYIKVLKLYDSNYSDLVPISLNVNSSVDRMKLGTLIKEIYAGNGTLADNPAGGIRFASDMWINKGVIEAAKLTSKFADVYFYIFTYAGPLGHSDYVIDGVCHGGELNYLFRKDWINLDDYPEADVATLRKMVRMWANFAKTARPVLEKDPLLDDVTWPLANSAGDNIFLYLEIGDNFTIKHNPKSDTMDKWDELYNTYGNRPYDTY